MFDWLRELFGEPVRETAPPPPAPDPAPDPDVTYLKPGEGFNCTYCGGKDFYEGPSGGMSVNMLCGNMRCRHKFNYTPMLNRIDDLRTTWECRLED